MKFFTLCRGMHFVSHFCVLVFQVPRHVNQGGSLGRLFLATFVLLASIALKTLLVLSIAALVISAPVPV